MNRSLTQQQKQSFQDQGWLLLKGAVEKKAVLSVKQHVLSELKRLNIWASGRMLSGSLKGIPAFQQITKLNQLVKHTGLQNKLISRELIDSIEELADSRLASRQEPQLLLSLPNQGEWTLKNLNWHLDIQGSTTVLPGVQAFVILDTLLSHGGGTLAVAGSHRMANVQRLYPLLKNGFIQDPDGTALKILEMTGSPGDVYLMDMRLIHTPSINSTKNVRMMATVRFLRLDGSRG